MQNPHNARVRSTRQVLPDDEELRRFPLEDAPADPEPVLILPEAQGEDGDAMNLFEAEGDPVGLIELVPAPPPTSTAPVPAPPARSRVMPITAAAAACVTILVLVITGRLSDNLWDGAGRDLPSPAANEPTDVSSRPAGQQADVFPLDGPDLSRNSMLDPSDAVLDSARMAAPLRSPEATPRTGVAPAASARRSRTTQDGPMPRRSTNAVAPVATVGSGDRTRVAATDGDALLSARQPVTVVAAGPPAIEVVPMPAPVAAPPTPPTEIPLAANPPPPAPTAIARAAPAVPTAPSATIVAVNEESAVRTVLNRYRTAYNDLDAGAAHAVWPSVDAKALGRAFDRLESQELSFDRCQIAVNGTRATASCGGDTRFIPKVGSRAERVEARQWTFDMRKTGEQWTIAGVAVR